MPPAGATPEGDGILVGAGPVRVDAFIDFGCPSCRRLELAAGPALRRLVAGDAISLVYHPVSFLDGESAAGYSSRAAAASGCAADRGEFVRYAHELFTAQPPEGGPGLSDAELAGLGRAAGLGDAEFGACLARGPYRDWPRYVTGQAASAGISATPAVLVGGVAVPPDPDAITAAVSQAPGRQAGAAGHG